MTADRSDEARYLRQKAKQFRDLARTYKTDISAKLLEIAEDLETRAETLEKGASKPAAAQVQRRFGKWHREPAAAVSSAIAKQRRRVRRAAPSAHQADSLSAAPANSRSFAGDW